MNSYQKIGSHKPLQGQSPSELLETFLLAGWWPGAGGGMRYYMSELQEYVGRIKKQNTSINYSKIFVEVDQPNKIQYVSALICNTSQFLIPQTKYLSLMW